MFCLKSRKSKNLPITGLHKWTIYLIGLFETLIFSACIFGWAQLVFVLKNEEIFLNLCKNEDFEVFTNASNLPNDSSVSSGSRNDIIKLRGCSEQDQSFALVFTIGSIVISGIEILAGFSIHYLGLVATRIYSTTALILGFLALGLTDKEDPSWLFISIILIAIGGGSIRVCALQFCNLFPKWRSTALTIISGSFSASSGLFLLFQIGQHYGFSLRTMSFFMSILAAIFLFATFIMPWHHILNNVEEHQIRTKTPLKNSVLSISFFTSTLWFYFAVICTRFYALFFNSWTGQIARTKDEIAFYSLLLSTGAYISPVVTPFPGILNDFLTQKTRKKNPNKKISFGKELKIPIFGLTVLLLMTMGTHICLLFNHQYSIYISIVLLQLIRPWMMSILSVFLRIRFPPDHFDRLTGISSAFTLIPSSLQYFIFIWFQARKVQAISVILILSLTGFSHPLHLLSKKYREKIADERFQERQTGEERSEILQNQSHIQSDYVKLNDH